MASSLIDTTLVQLLHFH